MTKSNGDLLKGSTLTLVLKCLSTQEMYGYELIKLLEQKSKGTFTLNEGTLYPILHSLEEDGMVESSWSEKEGARRRKYYRITRKGRKLLEDKKQEWSLFRTAVDHVLADRTLGWEAS